MFGGGGMTKAERFQVLEDYGIIKIKPCDGVFYFEREVTNEKSGEGV